MDYLHIYNMLKAVSALWSTAVPSPQVLQFMGPSFAPSLRQVGVLLSYIFLSRAVSREVAVVRDIDIMRRDGNAS